MANAAPARETSFLLRGDFDLGRFFTREPAGWVGFDATAFAVVDEGVCFVLVFFEDGWVFCFPLEFPLVVAAAERREVEVFFFVTELLFFPVVLGAVVLRFLAETERVVVLRGPGFFFFEVVLAVVFRVVFLATVHDAPVLKKYAQSFDNKELTRITPRVRRQMVGFHRRLVNQ